MIDGGLALYALLLCFFFTATVLFVMDLQGNGKELYTMARRLFFLGFLALTILMAARAISYGYFPIFTFYETLLFLAWAVTFVILLLERSYGFRAVFPFAAPALFAVLFFALFVSAERVSLPPEYKSVWLFFHIITIIAAYSTFAVAFVTSLMYLLVDNQLKRKKLSSLVSKLPSLDILDHYNYKLVSIGFFLLTISVFLGAFWAQNVWGAFWRWEPKEVWSLVTWIVYAAYLHTRLSGGWQGRRVAMLNACGFATVLFNYFVVRFFFAAGLHQFY
ncbi:MAG: c-type cytochrome biogenesis protein CcsB [Dethiobacter sp.]|nr:c-type cytochrome biogenesis protein CcsB [Dethiobacter sp.]MBS3898319.1 c-type cytochrome biogenesis protein CcsB [Dethiobacter sp.]